MNDTLVLVDYINRRRSEGITLLEAALEAGGRRFRPIMLTSVTTFVGLTPLMMDRSLQAQFLIPMAVSLAPAAWPTDRNSDSPAPRRSTSQPGRDIGPSFFPRCKATNGC